MAQSTRSDGTGYWQTVGSATKEKLVELGAAGLVLGAIWLVGLWVWYDWMLGAFREEVPEAGYILLATLVGWLVLGLAIYLWRDPHGVRSGTSE